MQTAILGPIRSPERRPLVEAALEAVVARLASVKARAKTAGAPVIVVQHDGEAGDRLFPGTAGWRLRPEIAPRDGEPLIRKTACDSFFRTDLEARLRAADVDHLVIGGCLTQYCVDTTCRRAVTLGFDVTLLADGHMSAERGGLGYDQIIAHHNQTLDGFDAGERRIGLATCESALF